MSSTVYVPRGARNILGGRNQIVAAGTDPIRPVWANEIGGLTFALGAERYVKWTPLHSADLGAERIRLGWAGRYTPVPRVLDPGTDALGVADRWADLAVATHSLPWNYDGEWEDVLLDAYGVAADPARIAYYRLLWDLSP